MLSLGRLRRAAPAVGSPPPPSDPVPSSPSPRPEVVSETFKTRQVLAPVYFGEDPEIADWLLSSTLVVAGIVVHDDAWIAFAPIQIPEKYSRLWVEIEWTTFTPNVEAAFMLRYLGPEDDTYQEETVPQVGSVERTRTRFEIPVKNVQSMATFACSLGVVCMSKKSVLVRNVQVFTE
jgi:hypothetical protein